VCSQDGNGSFNAGLLNGNSVHALTDKNRFGDAVALGFFSGF
jgi:hypothetical protein